MYRPVGFAVERRSLGVHSDVSAEVFYVLTLCQFDDPLSRVRGYERNCQSSASGDSYNPTCWRIPLSVCFSVGSTWKWCLYPRPLSTANTVCYCFLLLDRSNSPLCFVCLSYHPSDLLKAVSKAAEGNKLSEVNFVICRSNQLRREVRKLRLRFHATKRSFRYIFQFYNEGNFLVFLNCHLFQGLS